MEQKMLRGIKKRAEAGSHPDHEGVGPHKEVRRATSYQ